MAEMENENLDTKMEQEKESREVQNKKNTFTTIYILIGILILAVLAILLYALLTA